MSDGYRMCTRCVMDTTDPDIVFDENGICNHCRNYEIMAKKRVFTSKEGEEKLKKIVDEIKRRGRGHQYDCIIGLSGGVDSTYVAYQAVNLGLRPLAVTVDNGWDSETAKSNIRNIVERLDFDLHTYVVDWNEMRDLQVAYLRASVVNIEAITDHVIRATLYNVANGWRIKYILGGSNVVTEGIKPESWGYNTNDLVNLRSIHRQFGTVTLKTFPTLGLRKYLYYRYVKRINYVPILNYVPYVKADAKQLLARELGWRDYGVKHGESLFTHFYQSYILPRKFNIDKRKAHLSTLINSGQTTRDEALRELGRAPYIEEESEEEKKYVVGKLGLTDQEFEDLMNLPIKSHLEYESDAKWLNMANLIVGAVGLVFRRLK